jgi:predicted CoA-binding protein
MEQMKTLVLGASENPGRYSHMAVHLLRAKGHPVVALGKKAGQVGDISIATGTPALLDIDTVTLYLNPDHQQAYYAYLISLKPKRIIFNPGTENETLEDLALANGIEPVEACTLVLLNTGQY